MRNGILNRFVKSITEYRIGLNRIIQGLWVLLDPDVGCTNLCGAWTYLCMDRIWIGNHGVPTDWPEFFGETSDMNRIGSKFTWP